MGCESVYFCVCFSAIANECDVLLIAHIRELLKQVTWIVLFMPGYKK